MQKKKICNFKAAIFDLDGVIVNTVPFHFRAWKKMFRAYGKKITFEDYKKKVDGIPRMSGARAILTKISEEKLKEAAREKQKYYLEYINKNEIPIYKSTVKLIKALRKEGVKIAVASSSKNCHGILERTKLLYLVDAEVNGNEITKGKPHPQMFLMSAKKVKAKPSECVGFEDAVLGVEAIKRAKMKCVGVDRYKKPKRLARADMVVSDLRQVSVSKLKELISR